MNNAYSDSTESTPLYPLRSSEFEQWMQSAPGHQRKWLSATGFRAKAGELCSLPDQAGGLQGYVFGMQDEGWLYQLAALPAKLGPGDYHLVSDWEAGQRLQASIGWGLACYRFERYTQASTAMPRLVLGDDVSEEAGHILAAQTLVRDLVNTPTEDMGPEQLEHAMRTQADQFDAHMTVVRGEDLRNRNFPAVHVVGRASHRPPRLLKMEWGDPAHPTLALCGKGVCFDTGGLNLKPAAGMRLMKKDMGGAAHVLALARLIMQTQMKVRLLVLIPAVENSVSGNAYRPGDVIATRKGLSVEIGNTDAEGRVVLSDALTYACEQSPDLVIDFATLTGAARIALGADLPPVFSNCSQVAHDIVEAGEKHEDPVWMMPLYQPYRDLLKSTIADLNNMGSTSFGGCITAALFLEHFVTSTIDWVHVDTFAWNQSSRPGRPEGGEALGMRAMFRYLQQRYP